LITKPLVRAVLAWAMAALAPSSHVTGLPRSIPMIMLPSPATFGEPSVTMNMMFGASGRSPAVLAAPVLTASAVGVSPPGVFRPSTAVLNAVLDT
jgi:hypothetical protein